MSPSLASESQVPRLANGVYGVGAFNFQYFNTRYNEYIKQLREQGTNRRREDFLHGDH